jgi:hypothetical protein
MKGFSQQVTARAVAGVFVGGNRLQASSYSNAVNL